MASVKVNLKTVRLVPVMDVKYVNISTTKGSIGVWKVSPVDGQEGTEFPFAKAEEIVRKYPKLVSPVPVLYKDRYLSPFFLKQQLEEATAAKTTKDTKEE